MSHPVHSITDAPLKHSDEQRGRMIRYSVAMGMRIACFIAAAVVAVAFESPWALAFAAAAIVLPYVAVVDANAGGDRYTRGRESGEIDPQARLTTGAEGPEEPRQWWESEDAGDGAHGGATVIEGEIVGDEDPHGGDSRDESAGDR